MGAGQIAAAMLAVPNAFQAQDAGFNVIGRMVDIFPTIFCQPIRYDGVGQKGTARESYVS